MMHSQSAGSIVLWITVTVSAAFLACSPEPSTDAKGTGGVSNSSSSASSGGSSGASGTASSGGSARAGSASGSGGSTSSGGTIGAGTTGGSLSIAGATGSGGRTDTGGRSGSGGTISSGGTTGRGGTAATGGTTGGAGSNSTGGTTGRGGSASTGGTTGRGGSASTGGATGRGGSTATGGATGTGGTGGATATGLAKFSFFVTSIEAMRKLSKNQNGFGGDLRYGQSDGLAGADKICTEIAESSLAGSSAKVWRAFLSTTAPVNAADRIGNGPWYDRIGRLVADSKANLLLPRPKAATAIANDLPNEAGTPNHQGVDNHDTLTGSTSTGVLGNNTKTSTCNDWTSISSSGFKPIVGHAWPRSASASPTDAATNWMNAHTAPGCAPSVNISTSMGGGSGGVGDGGGYGALYCFALSP